MSPRASAALSISTLFLILMGAAVPASGQGGRGAGAAAVPPAGPVPRTPTANRTWLGGGTGREERSHTRSSSRSTPEDSGFSWQEPDHRPAGRHHSRSPTLGAGGAEPAPRGCQWLRRPGWPLRVLRHRAAPCLPAGDLYVGRTPLDLNQHITRAIAMDRREHLPEGIRLWLGDSIGHGKATRSSSKRRTSTPRHAWPSAAIFMAPKRTLSSGITMVVRTPSTGP